ncbi:4'-phosphopantetheinyl transferase superfamily protein [Streptomyces sp. SID685]|uniref:4'-phosphopantetheinyl transferase family protein n=1 Tax=Streptomyces sp. SID685 TaxID=2690322 RepID=UPI00136C925C|nr:4'-phosphopantetheinyl transferase superfamily protein [Streptomyces sp. SID685]MYR86738.1 4'-phosphopantetheinyl transferase superfamily protein [Streptomyces sp. SID685]
MVSSLDPVATRHSRRVFARPVQVRGPDGPWEEVREAISRHGSALVHARLDDWLPADLGDPGLAEWLGHDHARFRRMRHPTVKARFVASRLMLKHTAAAAMGEPARALELAYKLGGRPYLRGHEQLDISLTHTADLLVVGLARRGWIGVDAELSDRQMTGLGTEAQMCTRHELAELAMIPEEARNGALVRLWTLKEAYSKAIGQGLRFRFTEFGFGPQDRQAREVLLPDGSPGTGDEWSFHTCTVQRRYTVSVAVYDAGFGESGDGPDALRVSGGLLAELMTGPSSGGRPGGASAQFTPDT